MIYRVHRERKDEARAEATVLSVFRRQPDNRDVNVSFSGNFSPRGWHNNSFGNDL